MFLAVHSTPILVPMGVEPASREGADSSCRAIVVFVHEESKVGVGIVVAVAERLVDEVGPVALSYALGYALCRYEAKVHVGAEHFALWPSVTYVFVDHHL